MAADAPGAGGPGTDGEAMRLQYVRSQFHAVGLEPPDRRRCLDLYEATLNVDIALGTYGSLELLVGYLAMQDAAGILDALGREHARPETKANGAEEIAGQPGQAPAER